MIRFDHDSFREVQITWMRNRSQSTSKNLPESAKRDDLDEKIHCMRFVRSIKVAAGSLSSDIVGCLVSQHVVMWLHMAVVGALWGGEMKVKRSVGCFVLSSWSRNEPVCQGVKFKTFSV